MKEPKTIFGKVIAAVLSIFISNFADFVKKLWKKVPEDLQDKFLMGVKIVERVKTWEGGSFSEFLDHVLTDEIKDDFREQVIEILTERFDNGHGYSGKFSNPDPMLWQRMAADLNQQFTGVEYGQSVITTEVAYQNYKNA